MNKTFSLKSFLEKYSNDEACLEEIFKIKYPKGAFCLKCNIISKFYKVTKRPVYQCVCGFNISPLAGTIFEKTTTPLQYWFYAMFLVSNTRSGVSAKTLQREIGVTYKTAWRMFRQIRILMAESGGGLLEGVVEVDETFVGGKAKNRKNEWRQGVEEKQKEILRGMVERGGKVYMKHIPNTGKWTLINQIKENISPDARIMTDEYMAYKKLPEYGYQHDFVTHSHNEYARGQIHTQNIENVWSHLKRGITGVYRIVSAKYLQSYADEFAFRYNHRKNQAQMFEILFDQIASTRALKT